MVGLGLVLLSAGAYFKAPAAVPGRSFAPTW